MQASRWAPRPQSTAPPPLLTINFSNQNSSQNTAAQPGASLFGSSTNQAQPATGGLFGNTAAKPALSNPFGASTANNNAAQPQQSGGLFGSSTTNQPSGGLFGSSMTNNNASQPQQQSGGLFGNTNQQSGGLFGNSTTNTQPQQSGGLFGNTANNNTAQPQAGGLFGASFNKPQQPSGSSLFGASSSQPAQTQTTGFGASLFGNSQAQNQTQQAGTSSLFGGQAQNNAQPARQPTLLGTSIFNNAPNTTAPLAGSLTMGQGQAQQQTVPGAKIDLGNLRSTTRFSDLHDDIKKTLENIDTFIKQQESYAAQCEALLPSHTASVASVGPDVTMITSKVDTVELALENDSQSISTAKELVSTDIADFARCIRVMENLQLPSQFHYGQSTGLTNGPGETEYDVNLVKYFARQATAMDATLDTFTSNLAEIEGHLRVVEVNTMQQSAQIAAQRAGGSGAAVSAKSSVRELADTLRGFEDGILQAAGHVGACRDQVNDLIAGRSTSVYRR